MEAEGVGVDGLAHVGDATGAQDVEREGAQTGDDAGLAPDPAGVLAERAVADVMVAVLAYKITTVSYRGVPSSRLNAGSYFFMP